ncbi:unnamed protein product [Linum trigynum]|uniref:Uncharacterized protein n=1 Tax=Linum trigynum TaxID=586398 RepID=A0AAV2F4L3_9ROSI
MALPSFAMGSYGLLFRPKDVLFEIIDSAISIAASRWPEDLEGQRDQILKRLGLGSPENDQNETEKKKKKEEEEDEVSTLPDLSTKEKKAPAARNGKQISAEIIVSNSNCNQYDDVGRGRINVEVKLGKRPAKESAVGEARGKPRESSLEEKRKIDGDKALGFAREDRGRAATQPRKVESYSGRGRGESRGRRSEEAADHHYQRRRRSEDWYHGDYHRRRTLDCNQRRYGGSKRSFNYDERRYNGRRCEEEEERSSKRQRIVEEASATTTAGGNGSRRVIQYSRRFLLSMRPRD